jgi:hypothetical protein
MTAPEGTRKAEAGPHAAMVLLQTALGDILIELSRRMANAKPPRPAADEAQAAAPAGDDDSA